MRWEESVFALFEDLEMQAQGLYLDERVVEVEALAEAGYAEVELAARVLASPGCRLQLGLTQGTEVRGRLTGSGSGWVLLDSGSHEWLVRLAAVEVIEGLGASALATELWPRTARLSVGSALRAIAGSEGTACVLWMVGGRQVSGVLGRVGADFVELRSATADLVVPAASLAAVQGTR